MHFNELGLSASILKALKAKGYEEPTPIQAQAIPLVLEQNDLLGIAQTGTGKTAAFTLPIIEIIQTFDAPNLKYRYIRALILTPTRELAIQIDDNLKEYSKYTDIRHTAIYGGVKQHKQVRELEKGVHILVATPGRLLDLINQGYVDLQDLKIFVLDEADRMLDMGFIHDIKKLVKILPEERQSLFFSATMPENILQLSKSILHQPKKVEVLSKTNTADTVDQYVYHTDRQKKVDLLHHIISEKGLYQVLVFTRTKHGADKLARKLGKMDYRVSSIHGNKTQAQRQKSLKNFKENKVDILVATDIAARGIDIAKLGCVVNFDIPNEAESYVHRIGRSGRAGEDGMAISLCEPEELAFLKQINKLVKNSITVVEEHPYPSTTKPMTTQEKKEWNRKKQERRNSFFANRNKKSGDRRNHGKKKDRSQNERSNGEQSKDKSSSERKNKSKKSDNRSDKGRNEGSQNRPPHRKKKKKYQGGRNKRG